MKTNKGSALIVGLILFLVIMAGVATLYSSNKKNTNTSVTQKLGTENKLTANENANIVVTSTNTTTTPKTTPATPVNTPVGNSVTIQKTSMSHCGFTINSPQSNSVIHSNIPVVFSGVINNSNTATVGCSWTMFEGQAGTAQLWHKDGGVWGKINSEKIINVSNWMTTGPVPFTVSVDFNNSGPGFASGLPMKVVFTEENPSSGVADILEFPLIFQ